MTTEALSTSGNNKVWLMVGILAAVVVVLGYLGMGYPPEQDAVTGTIAPAERYRGEQISEEDVQLGDESVAQLMQTGIYHVDGSIQRC